MKPGLSSVLRPLQHSISYMGDGFYRSKDPTNSIKVLKEKATKDKPENANNNIHIYIHTNTGYTYKDKTIHIKGYTYCKAQQVP